MPRQPLHSNEQIATASAEDLREQLRWEFEVVFDRGEYASNEEMAGIMHFSPSSISKWRTGRDVISMGCAQKLDAQELKPQIGESFVGLRKAYGRASRRQPSSRTQKPIRYHVFLASPMASARGTEEYRIERESARDLKHVLETFCEFNVYYAGDDLESRDDFDTAEIAAEVNFEVIETVKFFVLLVQTPLEKPSGVHVEAGYALAKGIPSLYIVPNHEVLPFPLQKLGEQRGDVLPPVTIHCLNAVDAVALIKNRGTDVFARLERLRRDGSERRARGSGRAR